MCARVLMCVVCVVVERQGRILNRVVRGNLKKVIFGYVLEKKGDSCLGKNIPAKGTIQCRISKARADQHT